MTRIMRSPLFAALLAALLTASLFGVISIAQAGTDEIYTGCMEGGNLLNVRRGSNPRQPCNLATQQVSWPSTSRTNNQVADLQAQVVALQGDMATLQALLAGVTRSGDDLTFPRHVTAGLDVNARNVLVTNNVLADGSVSADNNVIAGVNLDVGNNAFVDGSVFADDDGDGTGDFVDNGTPLNVP